MFFVERPLVSAEWWTELLGVSRDQIRIDQDFAYFDAGDIEFGFHLADMEKNPPGRSSVVYVGVEDHAASIERATALGATLHRGPLDVGAERRIAQLVDPFGTVFGLDGPSAALNSEKKPRVSERVSNELRELLESMEPTLLEGEFVVVSTTQLTLVGGAMAMVQEDEGTTFVLARDVADAHGLDYEFVAAWITLGVHSALDSVGLTAAVSSALARADISCNVLAGLHHDHLLVPFDCRQEALSVLHDLAGGPDVMRRGT